MGFKLSTKNLLAAAAAPFTAGASLALVEDSKGNSLLGELTGSNSAKKANQANIEAQKAINNQNIAMQKETNQTTIDLANSAHQREVEDLKAAGLNPVLSALGTGAATPTLGTATAEAPQIQNELPGGYLAQIGQVANIANLAGTAQQAVSNSALAKEQAQKTAIDTAYAPQIAKSEIAKNLADAENATSSKQYNEIMGQVNQMVGDAQTEKALAEAGLIKKDSKGRITMNAINTGTNALNGIANTIGATKGMFFNPMTIKSNSARSYNYSGLQLQ